MATTELEVETRAQKIKPLGKDLRKMAVETTQTTKEMIKNAKNPINMALGQLVRGLYDGSASVVRLRLNKEPKSTGPPLFDPL